MVFHGKENRFQHCILFFRARLPTMSILRKQQAHGDNGAWCCENIRCRRRKTREQRARMGLMEIGDPFIIMSTWSIDVIIKFIMSCSIPKSQHKSYDLLIVLGSISMHNRIQKYANFSESSNILPIVSFLFVWMRQWHQEQLFKFTVTITVL